MNFPQSAAVLLIDHIPMQIVVRKGADDANARLWIAVRTRQRDRI